MKYSALLVICLFFITLTHTRGPLFLYETTTMSTTLLTNLLCYTTTTTTLTTCKKRKRRMVEIEKIEGEDELTPSIVSSVVPQAEVEESNSLADVEGGLRKGKFLKYWLTDTVTSTATGII